MRVHGDDGVSALFSTLASPSRSVAAGLMSGCIVGTAIVLCPGSSVTQVAPLSMVAVVVTTLMVSRCWGVITGIVHGCVTVALVVGAGWRWNLLSIRANRHDLFMVVLLVMGVAWLGAIGRRAQRLRAAWIHLPR